MSPRLGVEDVEVDDASSLFIQPVLVPHELAQIEQAHDPHVQVAVLALGSMSSGSEHERLADRAYPKLVVCEAETWTQGYGTERQLLQAAEGRVSRREDVRRRTSLRQAGNQDGRVNQATDRALN